MHIRVPGKWDQCSPDGRGPYHSTPPHPNIGGMMTARQAAEMGHGALLTNQAFPRVYSLCLEGGGNIIINTTANPQDAPTLISAATMGCRFEPANDPQHIGSLTYPVNILDRPDQGNGVWT